VIYAVVVSSILAICLLGWYMHARMDVCMDDKYLNCVDSKHPLSKCCGGYMC